MTPLDVEYKTSSSTASAQGRKVLQKLTELTSNSVVISTRSWTEYTRRVQASSTGPQALRARPDAPCWPRGPGRGGRVSARLAAGQGQNRRSLLASITVLHNAFPEFVVVTAVRRDLRRDIITRPEAPVSSRGFLRCPLRTSSPLCAHGGWRLF